MRACDSFTIIIIITTITTITIIIIATLALVQRSAHHPALYLCVCVCIYLDNSDHV